MLIEPDQRDAKLFTANTFSYRQRRELAEHAYQQTRKMLLLRQAELTPKLARHGVTLNMAVLRNPDLHLVKEPSVPAQTALGRQLHATLDDLQRQLGTPALGR